MINKCSVWINDISHKDFSFDGVVEILSGNELNVYVDSLDDSDTQALITFIQNNINEHPSLYLESPKFAIVCWDCFIKSRLFQTIETVTGIRSAYSTFDGSMICIGCNAWIDYPNEKFDRFIPFYKFVLDQGSIDLRNLGKWNTLGNNGEYDIKIDYNGIQFSIRRFLVHTTQPPVSIEEDVPQFCCEFENNMKYTLPELIALLASLRDFVSFITGRYIQLKDVTDHFQFERGSYRLIFHVDFSAYYPSISDEAFWGVNNVTVDELKGDNISKLFDRWQALYSKNSYPLTFFNRTNKDKLTPRQYITEVIIAFDSITDNRKKKKSSGECEKLKREIYQTFEPRFSGLGLTEKDISLNSASRNDLKHRIINAMSISGTHFRFGDQEFNDEEVATMLKNIRNSSAHGIEIKTTKNIRPQHYYSLGNFCEELLIQYIRREVLKLDSSASK